MHVTLVLTHECNLACTYCYAGEKFRKDMDWDTVVRAIEMAFAAPVHRRPWHDADPPVDVGFFGGEPLICWETFERACVYARARGAELGRRVRLAVTTNATLITPERARRMRELEVEVTVSLDGDRAAHEATRPQRGGRSSFDDVVRGARHLVDAGHPLDVIAVVAPQNVRHLGASVEYLVGLGARQVVLNPCYEEPWTDDDLAQWEQGMREAAETYTAAMRRGAPVAMPTFDNKLLAAAKGGLSSCDTCGSGEREVAVAPSGNLYPCARMVGEDRNHALLIGTLDTGIEARRTAAIARGPSDPACETCAEKWRCGASCACANLAETGTTHLPGGTQCWYEQASARIADEMGMRLLAEREPTFIAWIYGRVAEAAEAAGVLGPPVPTDPGAAVRRRRRLPLVTVAATTEVP